MSDYLLFSLLFSALLSGVFCATTDLNLVYCEQPVTVTKELSYCDGVYTLSVFPNLLGLASFPGSADVSTTIWDSPYISVSVSTETIATLVHQAYGIPANHVCTAQVIVCNPTKSLFTAFVTHYLVFAPSGGLTTDYSGYTVTQSQLVTISDTVTVTTGDTTCPAVDTTTVTTSVSYAIGTGNELTIYTSGPEPGTSTYLTCN